MPESDGNKPNEADNEGVDCNVQTEDLDEFDQLDLKLDELNQALDVLEQKNDDIHQKLKDLLQSSRDVRKEIQRAKDKF
ncbi:unnamed protein product [Leptidea sinapis]|uniref:Uncharacterized protein n=1 Tax=Leptidea sinapis TaxID=189913 RepID=A0A5E4Q5S7_9NEOP|nr:unnamed protein product [Leptidea sinapis]